MDTAFRTVLADYEARAAREESQRTSGNITDIDALLLPVGPDAAAVMQSLIVGARATRILELGTSYGYSTLWLADAARRIGGRVISFDLAADKQSYAAQQLLRAGLRDYVDLVTGDAVQLIRDAHGPFDFVFIDLWKDLYVPCLEAVYPKLADSAILVADNMTFPPDAKPHADAYMARVRSLPGMEAVLLPIGNGIDVARFRRN